MTTARILKASPLCAAVGLTVLGIVGPARAANLLANPGFEAPSTDPPGVSTNCTGWTFVFDCARATFQNHTTGGNWCVWAKTFQPVGGGITQNVDVTVGAQYDLSAFLYFETNYPTSAATSQLGLVWKDSGGNDVGTPNFTNIDPTTPGLPIGTWTQFSVSGTAPVGATQVQVFLGWSGGTPGGQQIAAFFDDADLQGIGVPPNSTWSRNGSGDWNFSDNWANLTVPDDIGAEAQFLGAISSAQTIYSNEPVTVGTMRFNNANTYVIAGAGSLTLEVAAGAGSVEVLGGSHKINLPTIFASNTNISVSGGATLTLADPVTIKANKTVTKAGTVSIEAPLTLEAGAVLSLNSGASSLFGAPTMGAGAKVDVKNNSVSIDYRGQGSAANAVKAQLTTGYNGGAWNGPGITTTSAVAGQTGVGWLDDTANQKVLVKYTYYGDTNLDGQVDITDLGNLATAWQTAGVWVQGDSDYSGFIDITDLGALATNWQAGVGNPLGPSFNEALAAVGLGGVTVPEPAALGLVGVGMGLAIRRRRI